MLVESADNDSQGMDLEPARRVSRLRARRADALPQGPR